MGELNRQVSESRRVALCLLRDVKTVVVPMEGAGMFTRQLRATRSTIPLAPSSAAQSTAKMHLSFSCSNQKNKNIAEGEECSNSQAEIGWQNSIFSEQFKTAHYPVVEARELTGCRPGGRRRGRLAEFRRVNRDVRLHLAQL